MQGYSAAEAHITALAKRTDSSMQLLTNAGRCRQHFFHRGTLPVGTNASTTAELFAVAVNASTTAERFVAVRNCSSFEFKRSGSLCCTTSYKYLNCALIRRVTCISTARGQTLASGWRASLRLHVASLVPRPSLTAFFAAVEKSVGKLFSTAAKKAVREAGYEANM